MLRGPTFWHWHFNNWLSVWSNTWYGILHNQLNRKNCMFIYSCILISRSNYVEFLILALFSTSFWLIYLEAWCWIRCLLMLILLVECQVDWLLRAISFILCFKLEFYFVLFFKLFRRNKWVVYRLHLGPKCLRLLSK